MVQRAQGNERVLVTRIISALRVDHVVNLGDRQGLVARHPPSCRCEHQEEPRPRCGVALGEHLVGRAARRVAMRAGSERERERRREIGGVHVVRFLPRGEEEKRGAGWSARRRVTPAHRCKTTPFIHFPVLAARGNLLSGVHAFGRAPLRQRARGLAGL